MCNAARHSAGCSCGFGPPYPGYTATNTTEWADEVVRNPDLIHRGLSESAWNESSIRDFLDQFWEIRSDGLTHHGMVARVKELLGIRRTVEEQVVDQWIKVPLYRFAAPRVRGAAVSYSEGERVQKHSGWLLKVFGIGTGDTTSVQVNRARTWSASAGTRKVVYVPIKLRVTKVAVYDGATLIGRGHNAQVAPISEGEDPNLIRRVCESVEEIGFGSRPETFDVLDCDLTGDRTGDVHEARHALDIDVAQELSAELMGLEGLSALVKVERTRRLEMVFSMPAGHHYRALVASGTTWWESPRV